MTEIEIEVEVRIEIEIEIEIEREIGIEMCLIATFEILFSTHCLKPLWNNSGNLYSTYGIGNLMRYVVNIHYAQSGPQPDLDIW